MPVTIFLHDLCRFSEDRDRWPSEFGTFIDAIQAEPDNRTRFLVFADWCDGNGEPWLARACRFLGKRPEIVYGRGAEHEWNKDVWEFKEETMPKGWRYAGVKGDTFAAFLSALAAEIEKRFRELEMDVQA